MTIDNSVLRSEIDLLRHGVGDAEALMGSLRRSVLYVPCAGEAPADPENDVPRAVRSGDQGGIRWIYAFTTPTELADFLLARGEGEAEVGYLTVRGDRLLDAAVPALGVPGGVAVDVAGDRPMLFPAVPGQDEVED